MNEILTKFIKEHIELINKNEFGRLYSIANDRLGSYQVSQLTDVLFSSGIDPLDYLTIIPSTMFYRNMTLTHFELEDNVIGIQGGAFDGCINLKKVDLNKCQYIYINAFAGCSNLTSIHIPKTVDKIYTGAFENCVNLKEVTYDGTKQEFLTICSTGGTGMREVFLWCSEDLTVYCSDGMLKS